MTEVKRYVKKTRIKSGDFGIMQWMTKHYTFDTGTLVDFTMILLNFREESIKQWGQGNFTELCTFDEYEEASGNKDYIFSVVIVGLPPERVALGKDTDVDVITAMTAAKVYRIDITQTRGRFVKAVLSPVVLPIQELPF